MRNFFSIVLLLLLLTSLAKAQNARDTTIQSFFNHLPSFVSSIDEAYNVYFPKNKITPCKQFKTMLQAEMNKLADASNHKSRLLSMIAGRFEDERKKFDFSKITISQDKKLKDAVDEMNISFFKIQDDFLRLIGSKMDSVYKQTTGLEIAKGQLNVYRKQMPAFIRKAKDVLLHLDRLMNDKGYNKVLSERNSSHPYYIQILEARGIILERISMLLTQIDGVQAAAASQVDICKRFPDSCK